MGASRRRLAPGITCLQWGPARGCPTARSRLVQVLPGPAFVAPPWAGVAGCCPSGFTFPRSPGLGGGHSLFFAFLLGRCARTLFPQRCVCAGSAGEIHSEERLWLAERRSRGWCTALLDTVASRAGTGVFIPGSGVCPTPHPAMALAFTKPLKSLQTVPAERFLQRSSPGPLSDF